jgi:hypothetical protein
MTNKWKENPRIGGALTTIGWIGILIGSSLTAISVLAFHETAPFVIGIGSALSGIAFLGFGAVVNGLWRIEMALLGVDTRVKADTDPRTDALIKLFETRN